MTFPLAGTPPSQSRCRTHSSYVFRPSTYCQVHYQMQAWSLGKLDHPKLEDANLVPSSPREAQTLEISALAGNTKTNLSSFCWIPLCNIPVKECPDFPCIPPVMGDLLLSRAILSVLLVKNHFQICLLITPPHWPYFPPQGPHSTHQLFPSHPTLCFISCFLEVYILFFLTRPCSP